jgi:hypothetical protein
MEYILKAAQQFIENMVKESYDAVLDDVAFDSTSYSDHYGDMGELLFKIHSYTKLSDVIRDIENGVWGIALIDQVDDQGMVEFFDTITKGGQHYLDSSIKKNDVVTLERGEVLSK